MNAEVARTGLTILSKPPDAVIDIVFVHGLQGDPQKTWTKSPDTDAKQNGNPQTKTGKHQRLRGLYHMRIFSKHKRKKSKETVYDENAEADAEGLFWPKDLLTADFPNARIITWGYNTIVTKGYAAANQGNIFSHARNLLYCLEGKRREAPVRDLVFIAHSLGGIIVKEVLRRSEVDPDPSIQRIYQSTTGVFFFGTPHRGSRDWASFGEGVSQIASRLLGMDVNADIVHALLPSGPELEICRESFTVQWVKRGGELTVRTYQEGKGVKGVRWGGWNKKIVPDDSSSLDHPGQRARMIDADHMGICKFTGQQDEGYEAVKDDLEPLVSRAAEKTHGTKVYFDDELSLAAVDSEMTAAESACLQSLSFPEMDSRLFEIDPPLPETCGWLFSHHTYRDWTERRNVHLHYGLLWIKGKPGSGKSTLMKEALRRLRDQQDAGSVITAGFFYHARRNLELERTSRGLTRSIVHQLLCQSRTLRQSFLPIYSSKVMSRKDWQWNEKELKDFLRRAFTTDRNELSTWIFVDALDECIESEIRETVFFFRRLTHAAFAHGVNLNVCLSSRHYPHITVQNCPEITVETANLEDISLYVQTELAAGDKRAMFETLRQEIVRKSAGIFLWAVLVVQVLLRDFDSGDVGNVKRMEEKLRELHPTLAELFRDLFKTLSPSDQPSTVFLAQAILFAQRPLSILELSHCMNLGFDASFRNISEYESSSAYIADMEIFEKRIHNLSRGLVECVPGKTGSRRLSLASTPSTPSTSSTKVQFIHQSVQDFFLDHDGLSLLDKDMASQPTGKGHCAMATACLNYMSLEDLGEFGPVRVVNADSSTRPQVFEEAIEKANKIHGNRYPFLGYAASYLFQHIRDAEKDSVVASYALQRFSSPHSDLWRRWKALMKTTRNQDTTLLYELSDRELERCVSTMIDLGTDVNVKGGLHDFPLIASVWRDNLTLLSILLKGGAKIDVKDGLGRTALHIASLLGNVDIVEKFLSLDADVQAKDKLRQTPLHVMVMAGSVPPLRETKWLDIHKPIMLRLSSMLLEKGAEVDARDRDGRTPLYWAVLRSDPSQVSLLLKNGADPNVTDNWGDYALFEAAQRHNDEIMDLLLDHGARLDLRNNDESTVLHAAVDYGDLKRVRMLMSREPDLWRLKDECGQTPLEIPTSEEVCEYFHNQFTDPEIQKALKVKAALGNAQPCGYLDVVGQSCRHLGGIHASKSSSNNGRNHLANSMDESEELWPQSEEEYMTLRATLVKMGLSYE